MSQRPCRAFQFGLRCVCLAAAYFGFLLNSSSAQISHVGPTPEQDDATLHDVQFVSQSLVYAVGDRGVVWKSTDGGSSWEFVPTPTRATLECVCFLTDRVGWIAGGEVMPGSQQPVGVLLTTTDGGETWNSLPAALPYIVAMRFFDLETGIVCGPSTWNCHTGVMSTTDGGQTWTTVDGPATAGWRSGAFINRENGILGGRWGSNTVVGNGRVLPSRPALGQRTVHDCVMNSTGRCWMVGDGGLIQRSDNLGASWQPPPQRLPRELEQHIALWGVASQNDHVWCVGRPGGVIWHSSDAGATWEPQSTADSAPLEAVAVAPSTDGRVSRVCAVGAFGRIVISMNGRDWHTAQGGQRRASLLAVHAYPHRVSMALVGRYGLEEGYRTAAIVPIREDVGATFEAHRDADISLHQALVAVGGNETAIGWELSISAPGLQFDREALISDWSRQTDDELASVLLSRLVGEIRMWKPDIVVYEQPLTDDAPTAVLHEALNIAIVLAADPRRHPELEELELPPWQVSRVVARLPDGEHGAFQIDQLEPLPRHGTTLRAICEPAISRIAPEMNAPRVEHYRTVSLTAESGVPSLFSGMAVTPGSESRRLLLPLTEFNERLYELASRQRNFAAYLDQLPDDAARAAQVVAQLREIVTPLPPSSAAVQLSDVAHEFAKRQQWALVEDVYAVLVERYPHEEPAAEAMVWLFHRWSSEEVAWQRLRNVGSSARRVLTDRQAIQGIATQPEGSSESNAVAPASGSIQPPMITTQSPSTVSVAGTGLHDAERQHWRQRTRLVASTMQQLIPASYASPQIQLALATFHSRQNASAAAFAICDSLMNQSGNGPWRAPALAEVWARAPQALSPVPIVACEFTNTPPYLDGILDEPHWTNAAPANLSSRPPREGYIGFADSTPVYEDSASQPTDENQPQARFAWDAAYLYLALNTPIREGQPLATPQLEGRTHDALLRDFDRWTICLDTDRDYSTWYELIIDQRGWTRDRCWVDQSWNPQWHVAARSEADRWIIEAAIPWNEMVARPPRPGEIWNLGVLRTTPGVGTESWAFPHGESPLPQGLGMLRFMSGEDR